MKTKDKWTKFPMDSITNGLAFMVRHYITRGGRSSRQTTRLREIAV